MRKTICMPVAAALAAAALASCSNSGERTGATAGQSALSSSDLASAPSTQLIPWGDAPADLGLQPGAQESAPVGPPAVAVGPKGDLFVLDALKQRIVRLGHEITPVAAVPRDADDLAVGVDGAFAVRRTTTPRILVLDPTGQRIGEVEARGVGDVDSIRLGPSRRVSVTTAFQETFELGGPSFPLLPEAVTSSRKVGAQRLPNGDGVVVVAKNGAAELRVVAQAENQEGHAETQSTWPLGGATAARIVGASRRVVCMRIENVDTASEGPIEVAREARCVDASSGAVVFRSALAAPGLYVPRRELTFARSKLVFAHPEKEGLRITTWTIEGGAR